jgi:hypothetical protein
MMMLTAQALLVSQNPREVAAAQAAQLRGQAEAARDAARDAALQARETAREAAQQARELAREQREAAQADREAAQAQREAEQGGTDGTEASTVVITLANGKSITLNGASPEAVATALGIPQPDRAAESDGPFVVGGIAIVATAIVMIVGLTLRYRAKVRGLAAPSALPSDLAQRMARMEAGIESVAVEVERISEGQRFTTRLLSDRAPLEVPRG